MGGLARLRDFVRLAVMAWLAVGCQVWFEPLPVRSPEAILSPELAPREPLRLAVSWAAVPLANDLRAAYEAAGHEEGLEIIPRPSDEVLKLWESNRVDAAILAVPASESPGSSWRRVARDAVVLIVNAARPLEQISIEDLQALYTGFIADWSMLGVGEGTPEFIVQPEGSTARRVFDRAIMEGKEISTAALILPHDEAVCAYVTQHPRAIGYLSLAYARGENGVRLVALDGVIPTQEMVRRGSYPLTYDLYLAPAPEGSRARLFVAFAISRAGREAIAKRYALPE